jgi:glutathione synthase/RimK-type ligase-like ATP-grasp enzyme
MIKHHLAIATSPELPNLDEDSQLVLSHLKALDIEPHLLIWRQDEGFNYTQMDACLVRSTWDYTYHFPAFQAWLEKVNNQTQLWNPLQIILENTEKTYLKTLEQQQIAIVPTLWTEPNEDWQSNTGWHNHLIKSLQNQAQSNAFFDLNHGLVFKPVVSASAYNTHKLSWEALQDDTTPVLKELQSLLTSRPMMIQPYLKSIETRGELSLMFMGGEFSHAVQKLPARNDFRIQEKYGGMTHPYTPSPKELALAKATLGSYAPTPLYARIDMVHLQEGEPVVMECELTEPSMYLMHQDQAPKRFAQTLKQALTQVRPLEAASLV